MKKILFLYFVLTATLFAHAQNKSSKRGISEDGDWDTKDIQAVTNGVSWFYDWGVNASDSISNTYQENNIEFVPMVWGSSFARDTLINFISTHHSIKYILGFNEPNFIEQADLTPSEAAANWPQIEAIADSFNLKIVGPAMNYCDECVTENDTTYYSPFQYLDEFFSLCTGCRVDYLAVHCYQQYYQGIPAILSLYEQQYPQKIWLTEFDQSASVVTAESQVEFMVDAVNYLENDTDVFRYAWFISRSGTDSFPYINLLEQSEPGVLTALGDIYVNMSSYDMGYYYPDSSIIQAEHYTQMGGIYIEPTTDTSGILDVIDIDSSDWLQYNINPTLTGVYYVYFRVSSNQTATLSIMDEDSVQIGTLNIPNTGGLTSWETCYIKVNLNAGKQTIRLVSNGSGFDLNWFMFSQSPLTNAIAMIPAMPGNLYLYPNPTHDKLFIETVGIIQQVKVFDLYGNLVLQSSAKELNLNNLPGDMYVVRVLTKDNELFIRKIVKQ